jgi:hypothetical protein
MRIMSCYTAAGSRYPAVTFDRDGLLRAVTDTTVEVLGSGGKNLECFSSMDVGPTNAVACFPCRKGLLVVANDGVVLHVP